MGLKKTRLSLEDLEGRITPASMSPMDAAGKALMNQALIQAAVANPVLLRLPGFQGNARAILTGIAVSGNEAATSLAKYRADLSAQMAGNPLLAGAMGPYLAQIAGLEAIASGGASMAKSLANSIGGLIVPQSPTPNISSTPATPPNPNPPDDPPPPPQDENNQSEDPSTPPEDPAPPPPDDSTPPQDPSTPPDDSTPPPDDTSPPLPEDPPPSDDSPVDQEPTESDDPPPSEEPTPGEEPPVEEPPPEDPPTPPDDALPPPPVDESDPGNEPGDSTDEPPANDEIIPDDPTPPDGNTPPDNPAPEEPPPPPDLPPGDGSIPGEEETPEEPQEVEFKDGEGMTFTLPDINSPLWVAQPNGLKIWDVQLGSGPAVQAGNQITVYYTGWLLNGTIFDSRRLPNRPVTFSLNGLIQGWQLGIPGMASGGIRRLYIPAALAYGSQGTGSIPPNSDLVFEIKLI